MKLGYQHAKLPVSPNHKLSFPGNKDMLSKQMVKLHSISSEWGEKINQMKVPLLLGDMESL